MEPRQINERLESILKNFLTDEGRSKAREFINMSTPERSDENSRLNHPCDYQPILEKLTIFIFDSLQTVDQRTALCRFMAESYERAGLFYDAGRFNTWDCDNQRREAYDGFFRLL